MENERVYNYHRYEETNYVRTWVETYQDSGWIIGEYGEYFVIWLDGKNDKPILATGSELPWNPIKKYLE